MKTNFEDVQAFHLKFGVPTSAIEEALRPGTEMHAFRSKFLTEEADELIEAYAENDIEKHFDALLDLVYVALGTLDIMGTNLPAAASVPERDPMHKTAIGKLSQTLAVYKQLTFTINKFEYSSDFFVQREALKSIVNLAYLLASQCNYPWQRGWDEVQRANMSKVRAMSAAQSTRGTALDVIKPAGWTPPDHSYLLGM